MHPHIKLPDVLDYRTCKCETAGPSLTRVLCVFFFTVVHTQMRLPIFWLHSCLISPDISLHLTETEAEDENTHEQIAVGAELENRSENCGSLHPFRLSPDFRPDAYTLSKSSMVSRTLSASLTRSLRIASSNSVYSKRFLTDIPSLFNSF